jgi:hypothetical protein
VPKPYTSPPTPLPVTLTDFVPGFLQLLYAPGDGIRLARLSGKSLQNWLVPCEDVLTRLTQLTATPNIYFAPAAFAPSATSYTKADCLRTRAFCVDIDYGKAGHAKPSLFDTLEDAWACLITAPAQPTCIWHTGHGLQAMYLLAEPYVFQPSQDPTARIAEYESLSRTLSAMVGSDATFTPEHMFRVPLTVNAKPDTPPVQGSILYWNPEVRHALADLRALCARYGVPQKPEAPPPAPEPEPDPLPGTGTGTAYASLPQDLRADIEKHHADRSSAMFAVIKKMVQAGYPPTVIQTAIQHGPDFRAKYRNRLPVEVKRCLDRLRGIRGVYTGVSSGIYAGVYPDVQRPLETRNVPQEVPIQDCTPLSPALHAMLKRYTEAAQIPLTSRILDSARFHEHLFTTYPAGVMESPCGSGKSTWGLSHIALHAGLKAPYMYVVDTLDTLYRAARILEQLNPALQVGRYRGFNAERCHTLCGKHRNWEQCNPSDPASVCHKCDARAACAYFNRDAEIKKTVVVMCHNGLVRLMEAEAAEPILEGVRIIVDEDLSSYLSAKFTLEDLELAQSYIENTGVKLGGLLPHTLMAARQAGHPLPDTVKSFAALHYVCRDERETTDASRLCKQIALALRTGGLNPFKHSLAEHERARQTVFELLNFFRPSIRGDATYAFREISSTQGVRYMLKKNRFDLGQGTSGAKLWILNASAQLAPIAYPESMPVYGCPDLKQLGNGLALQVIAGNPMQSKEDAHVETACRIIRDILKVTWQNRPHQNVFVATDRSTVHKEKLEEAVREAFGAAVKIVTLPRGRIRGSNEAGNCTIACLAGMSLFSTIDNIALTATLTVRRMIPVAPSVLTRRGIPAMSGGRFRWRLLQEIYALSALDELYQAIWRTALRNGQPVEAIIVAPDAEWLSVLWRAMMPGFKVHAAHKYAERGFKVDPVMDGFVYLISVMPGAEYSKADIARLLGYRGDNAWKDNAVRIMNLLGPFYEQDPGNVQVLRRKAIPGIASEETPEGPETP